MNDTKQIETVRNELVNIRNYLSGVIQGMNLAEGGIDLREVLEIGPLSPYMERK